MFAGGNLLVFDVTTLPIHQNNLEGMHQRIEINNPGSFYNYVKNNLTMLVKFWGDIKGAFKKKKT